MTSGYTDDGLLYGAQVRAARGWTEDYEVADSTMTQTAARRNWGEVLHRVRGGEVVTVSEPGQSDVVILDHDQYQDLLRDLEEMKGIRS